MAATNAAKQAKTQIEQQGVPGNAHAGYPGEPVVDSEGFLNLTLNRSDYMEVVGAVSIAAGYAAQRREFSRMTNLLGICNRLTAGNAARWISTVPAEIMGESPPLTRGAAAGG